MPTDDTPHDLAELRVTDVDRMAGDQEHAVDARGVETFEQHALADHARGTKDDDPHPGFDRLQRLQWKRLIAFPGQCKERS